MNSVVRGTVVSRNREAETEARLRECVLIETIKMKSHSAQSQPLTQSTMELRSCCIEEGVVRSVKCGYDDGPRKALMIF